MTKDDSRNAMSVSRYRDGLLAGNKINLGQAITLAESHLASDQLLAEDLIESILEHTGRSVRIGITGVPGVGKSTFIDVFGKFLTGNGKRVAVLTVDPSSQKTKGSILGDKTRMEELARDPLAFIRPSASGTAAGGVAHATRETILLCEAAGYEIILIETVGVGQTEVAVRSMADFFLLLMLPGSGDELQGIKKGIMEMADGIVITKADGDNTARSNQAKSDFTNALHLFQPPSSGIFPQVLTTSARERTGIKECWEAISDFVARTKASGFFDHQRDEQKLEWFRRSIDELIRARITGQSAEEITVHETKIRQGVISPLRAARQVVSKLI